MGADHRYDFFCPVVKGEIENLLFIASTPGLSLPPTIPLQPYTKSRPKTTQNGRSGVIDTTEFLLHSNSHPKIDYTAREEELGAAETLQKHYVGVFDPETGKLELVESRKMIVRGVVRSHQAGEDDEIMVRSGGDICILVSNIYF